MKRLILVGLVVLAGCSRGSLTGIESLGSALTVFASSSTPASTNVDSGYDSELGLKFSSDVAGTVNGVHFFKGTADTGTHTGHLWTSTGTLLATVVFSGESASGWQYMPFASPVSISAGTPYVISYHTLTGFSWNDSYFTSPVDVPPLHVPAGGGVFAFGTNPSFPSSFYDNSNYWVDVDFTASTGGGGASMLFDNTQTPATEDSAGQPLEFGVKFTVDSGGVVNKLRFYKTPNDTGTHVGHLWDVYGNLLATSTFTNETASGWQETPVSVPIVGGQTYTASYGTSTDFGFDNNFFTAALDRSPLHAPVAAGVYGNGASYPQGNFYQDNFWVDVGFATQACTPVCTSCNTSDGCGGTCCGAANYSVWTPADAPASSFSGGVNHELGTKFTSVVGGTVSDLRFFRNAGDTAPHNGHLWDGSGNLLGTATFSGTAPGWEQASLSSAVSINAGQTYVASYHSTTAFTYTLSYFTSGRSVLPLAVPANGGVFATGNDPSFPTQTFSSSSYWVDVVFHPTPRTAHLFLDTSVPSFPANGQGMPFEIGAQFTSDVDGAASQIRFYKDASNTGSHIGHLWDGNGNLLATANFSGETASGWQAQALPSPVPLTAGTTYVVSYSSSSGFAADQGFFGPGFDRPPLHVPAQGGVFATTLNTFPNQTFNASNYFVDVVFQGVKSGQTCVPSCSGVACGQSDGCGSSCCTGSGCTPVTCDAQCQTSDSCGTGCDNVADNTACTAAGSPGTCEAGLCAAGQQHSVFNLSGTPASSYLGATYELGMRFTSDVNATATKARFIKPTGATGPFTGHLWDASGTLLATAPFTTETPSGWQEASFTVPVAITANTPYVVSYSESSGFSFTLDGFDSPLDVPPLHVPASGGVYGAIGTFPTNTFLSANYWVDIVISN